MTKGHYNSPGPILQSLESVTLDLPMHRHCNVAFLAWKSRAICDRLIAFNRDEARAKTASLCRRSQENRNVFTPKSKLSLIPINLNS